MYHVISTGIATSLLYLISYLFTRAGFYSSQDHRKFWNLILTLTFLLTAIAGVFLALQITYKWNIPFIKSILKWHVECGTGLAFTGIFHFLWHLSYFKKILENSKVAIISSETSLKSLPGNAANLFIIGFVSTSMQLLLIREIMNIAGGYELITGTFLGSWLIGSAAGAAMARRSSLMNLRRINLLFAICPIISMLLLVTLERLFLNPGETPSFFISLIITLLALTPFCFISGFTFVKLIEHSQKNGGFPAGKSFSLETTGAIVAGITVPLLTASYLNTYQLILLIVFTNISYVLVSFYDIGRKGKFLIVLLVIFLSGSIIVLNPDVFFRQQLLPGIKVTGSRDTPYGNITTALYRGEKTLYYNQRLQSWSNDEIEREENIHYAMVQHANPRSILIISGDIKSSMRELLKYRIKKVVFVERDPALLASDNIKNDSLSEVLTEVSNDAFRYIKRTRENFDVIILLLPPPSTLQLNRFYTTEFFAEVKKRLGSEGIFACSPGSGENYYSKESVVLYSTICNSLRTVFRNVVPIVGNKLYFIASDSDISTAICSLSEKRKIVNLYVNSNYLSDDILSKKSAEVLSVIDPLARLNSLEFPVACFHFQSYNLSKNLNEKIPTIVLLILIFILPVFSVERKNLIMFSSAAALSGFEIIMLLVLQSTAGNMYLLTGLIIASLMTGLALGSRYDSKKQENTIIFTIPILLFIFFLLSGLITNYIPGLDNCFLSVSLILILIFIPAVLTGQLFSAMTRIKAPSSDPARVYSADLKGSALGFILVSGFVIPAFGIRMTIFLLSALIFVAFVFGRIGNKY